MFIFIIMLLLLVTFLLIKESALFNKWFILLVGAYYVVVSFIFINGYHRIHEKYNMYNGPVIPEGWEVNSNWAFTFSFLYIIPIAMLIFFVLLKKIQPMTKKQWIDFFLYVLLSGVILFGLFVIFNFAYGMRP
ncbi:hypothetical protein ACERII_13330 [Evansella sp. AB-rgal1]|uniref:hypothetical protein n=1 Tax=Evansella sp. AB-rgal1 TaxID=3242696 RepID=UPI00359DB719